MFTNLVSLWSVRVSLIAQFGLQMIFTERDYLLVSVADEQLEFHEKMTQLSLIIRLACSTIFTFFSLLIIMPCGWASHHIRYLPIVAVAIMWLKLKVYFRNASRAGFRQLRAVLHRVKLCMFQKTQELSDTHEMKNNLSADTSHGCLATLHWSALY